MPTDNARVLFRSGAVFNWVATLLLLPESRLANRLGMRPAPTGTLSDHVAAGAVGLFGVGYWMAGSAPERHRGIIQLGLAGKILVIALVLGHYLAGNANLRLTAAVLGDLIYSVLFARYLATSRSTVPT